VARRRLDTTALRAVDHALNTLIANPPGVEDFFGAKQISLALIHPNPAQPRKGDLPDVEDLAASIREHGLLQPIVVVRRAAGDGYTVVAGHRRYAAYQWLSANPAPGEAESRWQQIPAIERDTPDEDRLVLALVENISRADLTEAEIIAALRVLHDLRGWTQAEIARKLGKSRPWVMQYFRVASDPDVGDRVVMGEVSVAKAYDIVLASSPEAKRQALDAALRGAPQREVRRIAKRGPDDGRPGGGASGDGTTSATGTGEREADGHGGAESQAGQVPPRVATATLDAAARDLAELAAELNTTARLGDLQLMKLLQSALEAGTDEVEASALIKLMRADMRHVEALVRSQSRRR
jgi:ParB/RepB/Spo0J family partition protein